MTRELRERLLILLAELVQAYTDLGLPEIVTTTVEPGPVTGAYCCACREDGEGEPCGHAYIRVVRIFMAGAFPNQSLDPTNCRSMAALVEMGVYRCSPSVDSQGNAPSPEDWTDVGELTLIDAETIYCVLVGHNPDWSNFPIVISDGEPIGPEGGCVGFRYQFYLDVVMDPTYTPVSP